MYLLWRISQKAYWPIEQFKIFSCRHNYNDSGVAKLCDLHAEVTVLMLSGGHMKTVVFFIIVIALVWACIKVFGLAENKVFKLDKGILDRQQATHDSLK